MCKEKIFLMMSMLALFLSVAQNVHGDLNAGLVAYYPFSGNSNDESGNNLHGTVSGAALIADRFGNANNAYLFDGIDDSIVAANTNGAFDLTSSWSISAWCKPSPSSESVSASIVWKSAVLGLDEDTFALGWFPSQEKYVTKLERASDDHDFEVLSLVHEADDWHHVIGIYDGQKLNIYVNGNYEVSIDIGTVVAYTGPSPLTIGSRHYSAHPPGFFEGIIDDIYIYDRVINNAEITELYTIPEPTTLLLLGMGGLLIRKRK